MNSYPPLRFCSGVSVFMKKTFQRKMPEKYTVFAVFLGIIAVIFLLQGLREHPASQINTNPYDEAGKVVVSIVEPDHALIADWIGRIREITESTGLKLVYDEPEQYSSSWQMRNINSYIDGERKDIRYLVLFPSSRTGLDHILETAERQGVKVILVMENAQDYNLCAAGISIDYQTQGKMCAEYLEELFHGKEVGIVEITESSGSRMSNLRSAGFRESAALYDNLTTLETGQGNGNINSTKSVLTDILQGRNKDKIDAVFSCSDEDGIGALYALKLAGYHPDKDLKIISIGGSQDVLKAIAAEEYTATIKPRDNLGDLIAADLKTLESGKDISPKYTAVENTLVTQATVSQYVDVLTKKNEKSE